MEKGRGEDGSGLSLPVDLHLLLSRRGRYAAAAAALWRINYSFHYVLRAVPCPAVPCRRAK